METLKITKVRKVKTPNRAHDNDAGIDFYMPEDISGEIWSQKCDITRSYPEAHVDENGVVQLIVVRPGESVMIPSGVKAKLPAGHALVMMNKSGIGVKTQLDVLACVIDEPYQGEIHLSLVNAGDKPQVIKAGEKIVQGLLLPVNYAKVEEVENEEALYNGEVTDRSTGGFGSSGTN